MRGAGVVVDNDRQVSVLGDGTKQLVHVVVSEGVVGHRGQQDTSRASLLRTINMSEDTVRCAGHRHR